MSRYSDWPCSQPGHIIQLSPVSEGAFAPMRNHAQASRCVTLSVMRHRLNSLMTRLRPAEPYISHKRSRMTPNFITRKVLASRTRRPSFAKRTVRMASDCEATRVTQSHSITATSATNHDLM